MRIIRAIAFLPFFALTTGCCLKMGFPAQPAQPALNCGTSGSKTRLVRGGAGPLGGAAQIWNQDLGQRPYVPPFTSVPLNHYEEHFAVAIKTAQACQQAGGKCQAQGDYITECGKPLITMRVSADICDVGTDPTCHE